MREVHTTIAAAALILTAITVPVVLAGQHPAGLISVLPSDLKWEPSPTIPGAQIAMIEGDLNAAVPFTMRLKYPPNFRLPVHTHPIPERLTVIAGTYYMGIGDKYDPANARAYPAGSVVIIPAGIAMFVYTTEETILQLHGTGPWEVKYLNQSDNPLKKQRVRTAPTAHGSLEYAVRGADIPALFGFDICTACGFGRIRTA